MYTGFKVRGAVCFVNPQAAVHSCPHAHKASGGRRFVIIIPRPTAEAKVKLRIFSLTFQSGTRLSVSKELDMFFMPRQTFFLLSIHGPPYCFSLSLFFLFFVLCSQAQMLVLDGNYLTIITASINTNVFVNFLSFSTSLRFSSVVYSFSLPKWKYLTTKHFIFNCKHVVCVYSISKYGQTQLLGYGWNTLHDF